MIFKYLSFSFQFVICFPKINKVLSNQYASLQTECQRLRQSESFFLQRLNDLDKLLREKQDQNIRLANEKVAELETMQNRLDRVIQETLAITAQKHGDGGEKEGLSVSFEKTIQALNLQISNLNTKLQDVTKQRNQLHLQWSNETKRSADLIAENVELRKILIQNPSWKTIMATHSPAPSSNSSQTPPSPQKNSPTYSPQKNPPITFRIRTGGLAIARSQNV